MLAWRYASSKTPPSSFKRHRTSTSGAAALSLSATAAKHSSHRDCSCAESARKSCSRGKACCRASSACSGAPCAACRRQHAAIAAPRACGSEPDALATGADPMWRVIHVDKW